MFDIEPHTLLRVLHGSHAYGTTVETSDRDYRGVAVPPRQVLLGCGAPWEQYETKSPDSVVYELRKFCRLALDCNPNIIEVLFVPDVCVETSTVEGEMLRDARDLFLSTRARFSFAGYAHAQLKRIRGHRAWLLNPPSAPPRREDFGLRTDRKELNDATRGAMEELVADGHEFSAEVMRILSAEKSYAVALKRWQQYEHWRKERNPARAAMEKKYGYDTKHAMHLVRLMRMCAEILGGDGVIVRRPDAEELLRIRRGDWSYDQLVEWAEAQDKRCEVLYTRSPLPKYPDRDAVDALCADIVWRRLSAK